MLEMLAVLAIVGILSVAALAGLTWALAKYRANDTIHDVQIWYLAAADSEKLTRMTSGQLTFPELGSFSTHGYPMAVYAQDNALFYIQTADVPKRVCSLMLDMLDETWVVAVNDVRFVETDICDRDANLMVFYFNKDMGAIGSVCLPACADDQQCCNSACVTVQTPCGSQLCGRGCDYGGNCQTAYSENCAVFDDETGQPHCVMSQPVTDTCICPTDRSAVPGDLCCPEYHQNVNGVCAVVYCEDGAVVDKAGDGYSDCSCSGTIENGVCRTM